jgi:Tol biopolymer transport system component
MTAFDRPDRFERQLPERLADLAAPHVPDYFDSLLAMTARTSQRPRWASLERWLPMRAISRAFPVPGLPWRQLLIAALLLVAVAIALVIAAGSQPHLPPPFGPAGNGPLLIANANRDIVAVNVADGSTRTVLASASDDGGVFSSTGRQFVYPANTIGTLVLRIANADGSNDRLLWAPSEDPGWVEWSQDGAKLVAVTSRTATSTVTVIDASSGTVSSFDVTEPYSMAFIPYGSSRVVLVAAPDGDIDSVATAQLDGTALSTLPLASPRGQVSISPDGTRLAYASWPRGGAASIHVYDLQAQRDVAVPGLDTQTYVWFRPAWLADGQHIAVEHWMGDVFDVAVIDATGAAQPKVYGTRHTGAGGDAVFAPAPDGRSLIVRYHDTEQAFIYDLASGSATPMPMIRNDGFSWQRVALN